MVKSILHAHGIAPLKSRGQNFLINDEALKKIAALANIKGSDICIEIGPGLGALTEKIALFTKNVIAVEIDKGFVQLLRDRFANAANVRVIHKNILEFTTSDVVNNVNEERGYKVVGNLPYNIAGGILEKFLQKEAVKPKTMIITVQKEFAQKLTAKPPRMTKLGLFAQYYGKARIAATFPPSYFWPQPSIYSSLVEIQVKKEKDLPLSAIQEAALWNMVKTAFIQPRKMLKNSLNSNSGSFSEKRPQELSLEDWVSLITH